MSNGGTVVIGAGPGGPGLGGRAATQRRAGGGARARRRGRGLVARALRPAAPEHEPLVLAAARAARYAPRHGHLPDARRGGRLPRGLRARQRPRRAPEHAASSASTPTAQGWVVRTSAGDFPAAQVVVAAGYEHTPYVPDWPGRERFGGALLHAADYRNPEPYRGRDVLVVGPGCSGMEIAYDLAEGGAATGQARGAHAAEHARALADGPGVRARAHARAPAAGRPDRELRPLQGDRRPDRVRAARARGGDVQPPAPPRRRARDRRQGRGRGDPRAPDRDRRGRRVARRDRRRAGRRHAASSPTRSSPRRATAAASSPWSGTSACSTTTASPRAFAAEPAAPGLRFVGYVHIPAQLRYSGARRKRAAKAIARELRARSGQATGRRAALGTP